jgi:ABC-type multidrug transport system fused ATPase/permease subunit
MILNSESLFKKYLGYRIYLAIVYNILSTVFESFGILILYPIVLELINEEENSLVDQNNIIIKYLILIIDNFGLELNIKSLLIIGFILFMLKGIFVFIFMAYQATLRAKFLKSVKSDLFSHYSLLPIWRQQKLSIGETINIFNEQGTRAVEALNAKITTVASGASFIIYAAIAINVSVVFSMSFFFCAIFVSLALMQLNKIVRKLSSSTSNISSDTATSMTDMVVGFKYLYATGRLNFVSERIYQQINVLGKNETLTGILSALVQAIKEPVALTLVMVSSFISIWLFEQRVAEIIVCVLLIYKSASLLFLMQTNLLNFERYSGSIVTILQFMENLDGRSDTFATFASTSQQKREVTKVKKIGLTEVNHSHEQGKLLFSNNITVHFESGKFYGLIGKSGSGKSTMLDILLGCIVPTKGTVYVNGIELFQLDQTSFAKRVAYCTQDGVIFKDTLLNNILLSNNDKEITSEDQKKVKDVLEGLGMKNYLNELPLGLETVLGERGVSLSGGQKQRILLARELLRDSDILLLDEVTSALDTQTTKRVMGYVKEVCKERLVVMVTHNDDNLSFCDDIYEIKNRNLCVVRI